MLRRLKKNAQRHSGKKQLFKTICGWFCESFSRSFQRHVVLCCNFWKPLRFHKMVGSLCGIHLLWVFLVSRSMGFSAKEEILDMLESNFDSKKETDSESDTNGEAQ